VNAAVQRQRDLDSRSILQQELEHETQALARLDAAGAPQGAAAQADRQRVLENAAALRRELARLGP